MLHRRPPSPSRALPAGLLALLAPLALALTPACSDDPAGPGDESTATSPGDSPTPWRFDDVTATAGLAQPLVAGGDAQDKRSILEVNGNGAALVDLDGDGDLDLVLVDGSTHEAWLAGERVEHPVLENIGSVDGVPRFERHADTGLAMGGWPAGITAGDVDRDGRPDLVIGGHGEDALFFNRTEPGGPPRFERAPLPGRDSPLDWTTSVALADADADGLLDLYLVRYLELDPAAIPIGDLDGVPCRYQGQTVLCGPHGMRAQPDVFLRGLPAAPWFELATAEAGLADVPAAYGLGLLFADLDTDGDLDLYVANDSVDNHLFENDGTGQFREVGGPAGVAADMAGRAQAGMGVALGDTDNDGDFDLVVTNFSEEANTLYRNDGGLRFRDVSARVGLSTPSRPLLGWGVALADLDADGQLDLFFANGHVYPQAEGIGSGYAQPLMLLPGSAGSRFGDNVFPDGRRHRGRSVLTGDVDNDGDLDLLVLRLDDTPLLFLNRLDAPDRQLLVQLVGEGAADAFGATLLLETADGPRVAQALSATSFQAHADVRLHVVLPDGQPPTSARVLWPGGDLETLDTARLAPGRRIVVRKGDGIVSSHPLESAP